MRKQNRMKNASKSDQTRFSHACFTLHASRCMGPRRSVPFGGLHGTPPALPVLAGKLQIECSAVAASIGSLSGLGCQLQRVFSAPARTSSALPPAAPCSACKRAATALSANRTLLFGPGAVKFPDATKTS